MHLLSTPTILLHISPHPVFTAHLPPDTILLLRKQKAMPWPKAIRGAWWWYPTLKVGSSIETCADEGRGWWWWQVELPGTAAAKGRKASLRKATGSGEWGAAGPSGPTLQGSSGGRNLSPGHRKHSVVYTPVAHAFSISTPLLWETRDKLFKSAKIPINFWFQSGRLFQRGLTVASHRTHHL